MTPRTVFSPVLRLLALLALAGPCPAQPAPSAEPRELLSAAPLEHGLQLTVTDGTIRLRALSAFAFEVLFEQPGVPVTGSAALAEPGAGVPVEVAETPETLTVAAGELSAVVTRKPFGLRFVAGGKAILEEAGGFFAGADRQGFGFALEAGEKLLGGGSRVLGMDRRGHRLELYNKPSYGYETVAPLMYYSLPMVLSSRGYGLFFDNGARGVLDLGHTEADRLVFEAEGGRMSYVVTAAPSWLDLTKRLTSLTGRQPLPPRWALGNYASRMGYRTQAEVEWVVDGFRVKDVPLDAVILDLYWFGPDLKGHLGNLAWNREAWPEPEAMIQRLRAQGVKTILITEPFVLDSSHRFQEVAEKGLLAVGNDGAPFLYDFYFGHTGLLDLFQPSTRDWFWDIYRGLTASGVAGWWGDLGEPEVHPDGLRHVAGRAAEVHNLYGHEWAKLIAEGYARDFPEQRPLILMRAGFLGSQRYGMIPWSGDVNRTWGGFKPQVELALQMGLQGLGYMHSDLGGFAGNNHDAELYTRWLQYGVFQPVYRPHAQETVPAEPIFWDADTLGIVREFIRLRYALAPYNYTLAFQNSREGLPLMRPLIFAEDDPALLGRTDGYLWGDAFLVYPVTEPQQEAKEVYFPAGAAWFDFFTGERFAGGQTATVPTPLARLPVFVRAGSFVPMIPPVRSLDAYPQDRKIIHYWHDEGTPSAVGTLYEDDGETPQAYETGLCETFTFLAEASGGALRFEVLRQGGDFPGRVAEPVFEWVVHHWPAAPSAVVVNGQPLPEGAWTWDAARREVRFQTVVRDGPAGLVVELQ